LGAAGHLQGDLKPQGQLRSPGEEQQKESKKTEAGTIGAEKREEEGNLAVET
jgi:hypothetical protein